MWSKSICQKVSPEALKIANSLKLYVRKTLENVTLLHIMVDYKYQAMKYQQMKSTCMQQLLKNTSMIHLFLTLKYNRSLI